MINFDESLYERPIRAPVVDTFDLGNARVTADDLRNKWVPAANRRHNRGEHATIVIGHTRDGMTREEDQPTVVGVLTGPFAYHESWPGVEGPCVTAMHYISKERVVPCDGVPLKLSAKEILDRWPRRSAELWFSDYKIDPHCLLGATTPCRELGPLRLSRDGTLVVEREIPTPLRLSRDTTVADEKTKAEPSEKDTGVQKQLEALTQQVMALAKTVESLSQAAPAAGAAPGPHDGHDDEIEALLQQLGAHGAGEGGEEDEPEPAPKQEPKKMSRDTDAEVQELKVKLRRREIADDLRDAGFAKPDEQLVSDLSILPPDVYARQLDRIKLSRPAATSQTLADAIVAGNSLVQGAPAAGLKKVATPEDNEKIVKLARERQAKGQAFDYEAAAQELGYAVGAR